MAAQLQAPHQAGTCQAWPTRGSARARALSAIPTWSGRVGRAPRLAEHVRAPSGSRAARPTGVRVRAIGFELPGDPTSSKSVEKQAEDLTRLAASLLLYSSVLTGKPATAFLNMLLHLQKGSPLKLLEHYGELYRALAAEGRSSLQDWLLDQIIRGADNPFSRAAAKGEPTAHLLPAVAHDLDVLQQLSVTERTMATWVKEAVYGVSDTWLAAASSLMVPPSNGGGGAAGAAGGVGESGPVHHGPNWVGQAPAYLAAPLTSEQRALLAADIANSFRWSEAAPLLQAYHARHGFGLVASHGVLAWNGSSLQAQDVLKGLGSLQSVDLQLPPHSKLRDALERLVAELHMPLDPASPGLPPHHWCFTADPLTRWQLLCTLLGMLEASAAEGVGPFFRLVVVPAQQLGALAELAWALSQHPRARFLVVAHAGDNLPPSSLADLAAMLSGYGGFSWPPNATLIAGFSGELPEPLQPVLRNALRWRMPVDAPGAEAVEA